MSEQKVGRYEIKSEIGRGGMSTVYHAYDPSFKRDVAVKILPREFLHDSLFRARFEREAETIAALEHPAIVPVYDFGEEDGQLFLVMRFMGGGSLADRLERGPLSLTRTISILERLAPALDKAHGMGVIHRDLKSANILFDEDDNSFLSDFGIAKLAETTFGLTGTGSMIGTPAYMSPEQARGDPSIDGRSDLYAMGVILFEMLTGQLPFEAETPMGIAIKHITDPVPRILHFQPDLPQYCEAVIMRAMDKDPNARYVNTGEMVRDMKIAAGEAVGEYVSPPGANIAARPPDTKELVAISMPAALTRWKVPLWGWIAGGVLIGVLSTSLMNRPGGIPGLMGNLAPLLNGGTAEADLSPTPLLPTATATSLLATPTPLPTGRGFGGGSGLFAFVSGKDGQGNIYVGNVTCMTAADLCGIGTTQLTSDSANNRDPVWSPDGRLLLFRSQAAGDRNIYVMNPDGSNVRQLTNDPGADYAPAWSPDSQKIVFVSERTGNGQAHIFIMNADGSEETQMTFNTRSKDYSPSWSPDGKKIMIFAERAGNQDVFLLDAACIAQPKTCDNGQTRLTNTPQADYSPTWSPDGGKIVFVSERDGNPEIYIMNADGSNQTRLTENSVADIFPTWSPDGKYILFISRRGGNGYQLFLMNANGQNQRPVSAIDAVNLDPAWQP